MSNEIDPKLTGHDYDGIKELDNDLPRWWLVLFAITIIFAFVYWLHYEIAGGPSSDQELHSAMAAIQALKKDAPSFSEEEFIKLMAAATPQLGAKVYGDKCAACHGINGEGGIGPNLTDRFWIHGNGSDSAIYKDIAEGIPDKGMPAWKDMLSQDELISVTKFVSNMQGTNVPNGKEPQGTEY